MRFAAIFRPLAVMTGLATPLAATLQAQEAGFGLDHLSSRRISDQAQGFMEPSGLTLAAKGGGLWAISDETLAAFRLDSDGRISDSIRLPPLDIVDIEGIALDAAGETLLMALESELAILAIGVRPGRKPTLHPLALMAGYAAVADKLGRRENKGLEGIAVDRRSGEIYLVNETAPRLLLRISADLTTILDHRELTAAAGFAAPGISDRKLDVSGVAHDPTRDRLWIVSDEGARVFVYDWAANRAESAPLVWTGKKGEKPVKNAEGVAIDPEAGRLYVVTDDKKKSRLHVYAIR